MARHSPRDKHPEDIKAAVRKKGVTLADLARTYGLSDVSVRRALRAPHYYGELAISECLGIPASQIWPSRFFADGTRKPHRRYDAIVNKAALESHRLKAEAA